MLPKRSKLKYHRVEYGKDLRTVSKHFFIKLHRTHCECDKKKSDAESHFIL